MQKLDSTFKNMVLSLGGVTLIAAAALGTVYSLTLEPIAKADVARQEAAIKAVVPSFDNAPVAEQYRIATPEGDSLICFPGKVGGKLSGVAIQSYTKKGFNGVIDVMVGLSPDGSIVDYSVLKHAETPGLGSKMQEWFRMDKNRQSILGFNPGEHKLWVSKDGGDIDAITAATISSRAFLDAVDRAYRSYMASLDVNIDARTGATASTDSIAASKEYEVDAKSAATIEYQPSEKEEATHE